MIDSRELRIGNYVNYNDGSVHDDIRKVVGIEQNSVSSIIKGCHFATAIRSNDLIYSIPLSEEVLLKCGFIKYQWQNAFYKKIPYGCYLYIHFFKDEILVSLSVVSKDGKNEDKKKHIKIGNSDYFKDIKHLHQLQNLYYCLTQTELEVEWDNRIYNEKHK